MERSLRQYIGIPFEEADCWQLFCRIYREICDIELPSLQGEYTNAEYRKETSRLFVRDCRDWIPIEAGQERFADAVVMHILGLPCHIGFAAGGGKMIHAQKGTDSTYVSYREHIDWRDRKKSFYRHPALAD